VTTAGLCAGVFLASVLSTAPLAQAAPATGTELAGKTVFLDPGHQGTNHTENLSKQVSDGRGGTKDCQTTGMTALGGTPEHTITWNVAQLVKTSLESVGAKVVMSRADDSGWGGCVDDRARAANASGAQVAVSIHADSTSTGSDAQNHGFHVIVPTLPIPDATANAVQTGAGRTASTDMRDAYEKAGFTGANYADVKDGIQERSDIAGPALTTVPDVFLEMGNGSNPDDAKILESTEGQVKHAIAITTGIVDFLLTGTPAATTAPTATAPSATAPSATAPSTTTPAAPSVAVPSTPAAALAKLPSGLAEQLSVLTPLLESFGLTGIDRLLTEKNVSAVLTIVSTLFTKLLSAPSGG
jgi:N-acetylmuramoyl-L-alanine amidase